jgi:hypothetical protein
MGKPWEQKPQNPLLSKLASARAKLTRAQAQLACPFATNTGVDIVGHCWNEERILLSRVSMITSQSTVRS